MSHQPVVSVILPVRDGAATIAACLDALASQRNAPAYEVIVVDNGSADATADVVRRHRLDAVLLSEPQPGSYRARNAGIAAAGGQVLAFTDADCVPDTGWVAAICGALDGGADLAAGRVAMFRSPRPTLVERYDRAVYLRQEDLVTHHGWAVTANLAVRRSVIDAIGRFDASLPSGGDRDFCLRARANGLRLLYVPEAVVRHPPRTRLREIWRVNRRIGNGLRRRPKEHRPRPWRDPELRQPLAWVLQCVAADGPALRRRQLAGVHVVAMAARWVGLVTGR